MFLESIYSDTYDMPIACYKNSKLGEPPAPTYTLGGTTCPTPTHYLADPEPMALPLQPVDHVCLDQPSPCAA